MKMSVSVILTPIILNLFLGGGGATCGASGASTRIKGDSRQDRNNTNTNNDNNNDNKNTNAFQLMMS